MRKLTGLFAALLFAVAVSPAVASTSDSASNDYTATVNSDVSITLRTDGTTTVTDDSFISIGSSNAATGASQDGSGNVSVTVDPTAGDVASFSNAPQLDIASNVAFDLGVTAQTGTAGTFDGTGETFSMSNLGIALRSPISYDSTNWKTFAGDGSELSLKTAQAAGEYSGQEIGYRIETPDSLSPGTYEATLQWSITPN